MSKKQLRSVKKSSETGRLSRDAVRSAVIAVRDRRGQDEGAANHDRDTEDGEADSISGQTAHQSGASPSDEESVAKRPGVFVPGRLHLTDWFNGTRAALEAFAASGYLPAAVW